ncbi:hypothetical protein ACDZ28_11875 [Paenibacillus sp. RS8]
MKDEYSYTLIDNDDVMFIVTPPLAEAWSMVLGSMVHGCTELERRKRGYG